MSIVVAAVKADGEVSDAEVRRLRAMCALSPLFERNTSEQDTAAMRFAGDLTQQLGDAAITKAAEVLSPELRETAFAFAVDMVLADGLLGRDEENFITGLAGQLGVTEGVARSIILTTLIRNRGEE